MLACDIHIEKDMGDQMISFDSPLDSGEEDEVPEMRKKTKDPVDGLISTLRKSKNIRTSFNQANLFERQDSQNVQAFISSLQTSDEVIAILGGQDFTDLIQENRENISSSAQQKISGPSIGPPPPPPGPMVPPLPPSLKLQAVPENRMVKLNWTPVRKEKTKNSVWEKLPKTEINKDLIQKLFTVTKPISTNKKNEEVKEVTILNVLDMRRSNNINIALKRYKHLANLKNKDLDFCGNINLTKEDIEVIQKLYFNQPNIKEEIIQIEDAVETYPNVPLGTAEQFLLDVKGMQDLKIKLRFFIFKIDFPAAEEFISKCFRLLKDETEALKKNKNFLKLLSIVLETGKVFEKKEVTGFELDFLGELDQIKDSVSKQTLLYHIIKKVTEKDSNFELFSEETYQKLMNISKYDFSRMIGSKDQEKFNIYSCLEEFEDECGTVLANILEQPNKEKLEMFLKDSLKRIVSLKKIHTMLMKDYTLFLNWLALPATDHADFSPDRWADLMVKLVDDIKKTRRQLEIKSKKVKKSSSFTGNLMNDLKKKVKN